MEDRRIIHFAIKEQLQFVYTEINVIISQVYGKQTQ